MKTYTTKMNEAVSLIVSIEKGLKKGKKKQVDQKTDLFTIVGDTGEISNYFLEDIKLTERSIDSF